jgi:hypothetical protein
MMHISFSITPIHLVNPHTIKERLGNWSLYFALNSADTQLILQKRRFGMIRGHLHRAESFVGRWLAWSYSICRPNQQPLTIQRRAWPQN